MKKSTATKLRIAFIVLVVLAFIYFMRQERYTKGDTKFFKSDIPEDAIAVVPGELESTKKYSTSNNKFYLQFREDQELVWVDASKPEAPLWTLGSVGAGADAKATFETDGNICVRGSGKIMCSNSQDKSVPLGQHLLILDSNGAFYRDSGKGLEEAYSFHDA